MKVDIGVDFGELVESGFGAAIGVGLASGLRLVWIYRTFFFSFQGEQGPQGDQGREGPVGVPGDPVRPRTPLSFYI